MSLKLSLIALVAGLTLPLAAIAAENAADASQLPPPSDKTGLTFEKDISPIFETSCVRCHGEERPKAHLNLHTLAGALKGAGNGPVVVPGDSVKSRMVASITYTSHDKDGYMPPPNNRANIARLTAEQVGLIRAWIDQGAK